MVPRPLCCTYKPLKVSYSDSLRAKQRCFTVHSVFRNYHHCKCKVMIIYHFILDEPFELLGVVRTAVVGGPGVADGELVKLEHVHNADLGHGTAEQIRTLVHTRSWWNIVTKNNLRTECSECSETPKIYTLIFRPQMS